MIPFEPLTVGYDWEIWLLEATGEPAKETVILDIAGVLRRARPECPIDYDFRSLEIRSGPCRHVDELRERTDALLAHARREARKRRLLFLLSSGHPTFPNVLGAHVHVGSLYDLVLGARIRTALMPHLPALIALSAASPVAEERHGWFKSYRVALRAHGCNVPNLISDPETSPLYWGEDACIKVAWKPTIELRLFDAPIHPGLYLEMAVLGAGLVAGIHRRLGRKAPRLSRRDGEDYMLNRLAASRHGLQATLRRGDEGVPAADAVREALEIAGEDMTAMGLPPADLVWIPMLLAGRVTQADFVNELFERNPEPWSFVTDLAAATADGRGFERWLAAKPRHRQLPVESFGPHILRAVDGQARVADANRWLLLPPYLFEREVRSLEREGKIERIEDRERGLRFRAATREDER